MNAVCTSAALGAGSATGAVRSCPGQPRCDRASPTEAGSFHCGWST
ncbi:hypothetical protein WJ972_10320 [Achromobacter insuavis]